MSKESDAYSFLFDIIIHFIRLLIPGVSVDFRWSNLIHLIDDLFPGTDIGLTFPQFDDSPAAEINEPKEKEINRDGADEYHT
jgi:hypothetical protein